MIYTAATRIPKASGIMGEEFLDMSLPEKPAAMNDCLHLGISLSKTKNPITARIHEVVRGRNCKSEGISEMKQF